MARYDIVPNAVADLVTYLDQPYRKPAAMLWLGLAKATGSKHPILLSSNDRRSIKVRRDLVPKDLAESYQSATYAPLKVLYGRGSPNGGNSGDRLEAVILKVLTDWKWYEYTDPKWQRLIEYVDEEVALQRHILEIRSKSKLGKVEERPLQLDHRGWVYLGGLGDTAASRTGDIEIVGDGWTEHISVKTGLHHSFMNIGLDKAIPISDFDDRKLSTDLGKVLFKTLGIDEDMFFEVFHAYQDRKNRGDYLGGKGSFIEEPVDVCRDRLKHLLRPILGNGYWLLHASLDKPDDFRLRRMGEAEINKYLDFDKVVVRYPRIGSSKKVGVRLYLPRLPEINYLEFSIREKNGKDQVWPRHCVVCAYLNS